MTVRLTDFVLTFMDCFDTDEGRAYLREILDEVIDNYLQEHPDQSRDQVIQRFILTA